MTETTRKNKDNPVALGVMSIVLAGSLFMVGKALMNGSAQQQAVRATVAAAGADSAIVNAGAAGLPESVRDPFSSPVLLVPAVMRSGDGPAVGLGSLNRGPLMLQPVTPIRRNAPISVLTPIRFDAPAAFNSRRATALNPAAPHVEEETNLARSLRVTAIVMGPNPYAVVEPAGSPPCTLHGTEKYKTLRLMSIRSNEIVLKGESGLWTLPLATAETEPTAPDGKN